LFRASTHCATAAAVAAAAARTGMRSGYFSRMRAASACRLSVSSAQHASCEAQHRTQQRGKATRAAARRRQRLREAPASASTARTERVLRLEGAGLCGCRHCCSGVSRERKLRRAARRRASRRSRQTAAARVRGAHAAAAARRDGRRTSRGKSCVECRRPFHSGEYSSEYSLDSRVLAPLTRGAP
jgi:hypothetical protein